MVADREQVCRTFDLRVQQQVVCHHVFAQFAGFGNGVQLPGQANNAVTRLHGAGGEFEEGSPHPRKALQIWDDGINQFVQQRIEGLWGFGFAQERFDLFEISFKVGSESYDLADSHAAIQPVVLAARFRLRAERALRACLVLPAEMSAKPLPASSINSK